MPLYLPQISHGLRWDRTRASVVTVRRLTTYLLPHRCLATAVVLRTGTKQTCLRCLSLPRSAHFSVFAVETGTATTCLLHYHQRSTKSRLGWDSEWLRAGQSGNRIPVGGEIFRTRPDRPWGPPSLLYDGYRISLPRVKRPERGDDHPPPFSTEIKETSTAIPLVPFRCFVVCS